MVGYEKCVEEDLCCGVSMRIIIFDDNGLVSIVILNVFVEMFGIIIGVICLCWFIVISDVCECLL